MKNHENLAYFWPYNNNLKINTRRDMDAIFYATYGERNLLMDFPIRIRLDAVSMANIMESGDIR